MALVRFFFQEWNDDKHRLETYPMVFSGEEVLEMGETPCNTDLVMLEPDDQSEAMMYLVTDKVWCWDYQGSPTMSIYVRDCAKWYFNGPNNVNRVRKKLL